MPLPIANCAADISSDVCCDTIWLMGERIRTVALDAVLTCVDDDCANEAITSWQTEGDRSGSVKGNTLVVSFVTAALAPSGQRRSGSPRPTPITRASFRVELRETGWPFITERASVQSIKLPDPQIVHAVAKHARAHGERMWRALLNAGSTTVPAQRMFDPLYNPHIMDKGVGIGTLRPRPSANMVTYEVDITVDHVLP